VYDRDFALKELKSQNLADLELGGFCLALQMKMQMQMKCEWNYDCKTYFIFLFQHTVFILVCSFAD